MRKPVKTRAGGVPVVAVDYDIEDSVLHGILAGVRELGWRIVDLRLYARSGSSGGRIIGLITNKKPDAELVTAYVNAGMPYVILSAEPFLTGDIVNIRLDRITTGILAAEHFAARGTFNLGYLAMHDLGNHAELYSSFATKAQALECDVYHYQYDDRLGDAINSDLSPDFQHWLETVPKPFGILVGSDLMGAAVCAECLKLGWSIPRDIAILGVGNNAFYCESSVIPLSSIDPDQWARGRQAVTAIYDLHTGGTDVLSEILIPPKEIVERRSTSMQSMVAEVLRFMHDNLQCEMTIADIADEFRVSRRTIERAFKEERGTSANGELQKMRLEKCCDLLKSTNLKAAEIASLVGFSSKDYLQRVFKKRYGVSLQAYRQNACS